MDLLGLALGALGVLPVVAAGYVWSTQFVPARRLFGFGRETRLDVVITTSARTVAGAGPAVSRPLTGVGQVQGVAHVARSVGRIYRQKRLDIHMSEGVSHRLDSDLVVLGGPLRNRIASDVLARFPQVVFDDGGCCVSLGETRITDFDVEIEGEFPRSDVGLILIAPNPFAQGTKATVVLCAGFTSYGTSATAELFFEDIALRSRRRRAADGMLRRDGAGFAALVRFRIVNGTAAIADLITVAELTS